MTGVSIPREAVEASVPAPGKYQMRATVEVDSYGLMYPHDTGEMHFAEWWVQRGATFLSATDQAVIREGRRAQQDESDHLRAQVQALQAEVNRLNKLHDERDAIERGRAAELRAQS